MDELVFSQDLLDEFVKRNNEVWKQTKPKQNNQKYIHINFIMVARDLALMMPKLLYAKGLEQETGAKPIVIDWKYNEQLNQLLESFGIEYVTVHDKLWKQVPSIIGSVCHTLKLLLANASGEDLKKVKWKSIPVGMHLYEDFLRSSELSTIRTVRNKTVLKKLISMHMFIHFMYNLCKSKAPDICVADDFPYNEGLAVAIQSEFGAKIVQMGAIKKEWIISYGKNQYSVYRHEYLHRYMVNHLEEINNSDYLLWTNKYLEDRFNGRNGVVIDRVAYTDKTVCSREQLVEQLGLDSKKKNVVIMAHVFSDATFQSGNIPFRDNYDWTESTLKYVKDLDNVNWIIKLHPARNRYNDSMDSIETLVEKYKSKNIFVFPEEYSAESILSVADALVTICGTSGIEYTCFGIPAVIVGDAFYNGFGFTNHPNNQEEYFEILSRIDTLQLLSVEQKNMARKILYLYGHLMEYTLDEYDRTLSEIFNNRLAAGDATEEYQNKVLLMFDELIEKNKLKELAYFELGTSFIERYEECH